MKKTDQNTFKVFVFKYALTRGIFEVEVVYSSSQPNATAPIVTGVGNNRHVWYEIGVDCSHTMEEAKGKARVMRDRKLKSLKRAIERLEKLPI